MANKVSPIPPGFHSLTVHMNVDGAAKYVDFLKAAFGAEEKHRSLGPGGKIMHATVKIGDSLLMLADDFSKEFGMPPFVTGNFPFVINLYVEDADAAWAKALAAGCEVKFPIADQFWGDRYGQVKDPAGFVWAISSAIEQVSPEELEARQAKAFGGGH
jgi:PhnB protein